MPEPESNMRLSAMADYIDALLAFAEQANDNILAAKIEEAKQRFMERHLVSD